MTFPDLQNRLKTGPDNRLRVDGSALSTSVASLFDDFLSGRVIEFQKADAKPDKFKDCNQELDSVYVVGTLDARFLGVPSPHVEAWFFLISGDAEVVMTFPEMPDLSQSFQKLAERAAFSKCVFTLDSRRPNPLGDDFNTFFSLSSVPASKGGLRLNANLQVSTVDETLAQFGLQNLTVAGPVELADDMPRMRLATEDPVVSFEFQGIALKLEYEYLTAPVLGRQITRERLSTTLGYHSGNANLTFPLALNRDPDTLPESLIIESGAGFSSLLTFDTLKGLLPGEISAEIPPDFPLKNLTLTKLSLEVGFGAPSISVRAVHARVEVLGKYPIVEYKNLLTFANPGLEFIVTNYGDEWEVQPYIVGKLELAGGKLTGVVDLYAKSFFCVLDDDSHVDLKNLLEETLELRNALPRWDRFDLTRFEIWGDMEAKMFALDIGTSMNWPLDLGTTPISVEELFLSLEYADSSFAGTLGGSLAIGGVTAGILAKYDAAGWTFEMTAYNLALTDLFASVLADRHLADELPKVVFPHLGLTVTPKTGAFRFNGEADVFWRSPFDMNAEFDCAIQLTLERQAAPNVGNQASVKCNVAFDGKGNVRVNGRPLSATLSVVGNKHGPGQLVLAARGTLSVGDAQFIFEIASGQNGKELSATWEHKDSEKLLNLKDISEELPDLPGLEALIPKRAQLNLKFSDKRMSLACEFAGGAKAVFLLQHDSVADTNIVALGLTPGIPISTKNLSLGALGSALEPYSIALDDLVVVAANATAPKDLKLPLDWKDPFTKGLLLGGILKFEGTSFSYPFECRLGSEKPESRSSAEGRSLPSRTTDEAPKEVEQGKNNVVVGRTIGPITFRKTRLESRESRVYVLLDASLGSGGFDLDLTGFNLNFPLAKLTKPSELIGEINVGLDGLSIAYSKPPLIISGGFAKTAVEKPYVGDVYSGHLLIKAATFQITVLGKYGTIKAEKPETEAAIVGKPTAVDSELVPSLFLYGIYDGVVGGPAAFFVTGLALGGGYNTRLALPTVEKVADFPLIQAATNPEKKLTSEALNKIVLPSFGDYWLAVGVKFHSFKMAESFALFSVSFGNRLQFALLGLTKLTVPTGAVEGKCAVYAELAIRAVLDPAAGVFSIQGQLTENSYVFAKEFRLTGGFAFFVWFGNAKEAGDFVISLGGYHPDFLPPAHYPVIPRVGISAKLSDALTIMGEAYLAITPSCLMAGLKLAAVFESGNLKAAFVAYADFIIAWAPFHYDASIGIGIAVIYQRFKLEVSASLHIWGPPFAGTARVSLWILSFTVEFGSRSREKPDALKWPEFQEAFLPARVSTIRITEGLVREVQTANETYRIVNSHELMIETDSAVPCSEVSVGAEKRGGTTKIGITPMEATNLISTHVVSIKDKDGTPVEEKFRPVQWSQKNYPEALWSAGEASGELETKMIKDVPSGVVLRVKPTKPEHRLGPFLIEKFKHEPISNDICWSQSPPRPNAIDEQFPEDPEKILPLLRQIRDCLPKSGKSRWNEIAMDKTFAQPNELFQELPTCAALGQSLGGY